MLKDFFNKCKCVLHFKFRLLLVFILFFVFGLEKAFPSSFDFIYKNGIEDHPFDYALYGMFSNQNDDGSICLQGGDCILETFYSLRGIKELGFDNEEIKQAYLYLDNVEYENSRELAIKIETKIWRKQNVDEDIQIILDYQNDDGGISWRKGYESDLLTSLMVRKLLSLDVDNKYNENIGLIDSYLNKFLKNGAMSFGGNTKPDFYLNILVMDYFRNSKFHDIYVGAKEFVLNYYNNKNDIGLEEKLYLSHLIGDSNEQLMEDVKMSSMGAQQEGGLLGSILKTSLSLANFSDIELCLPPMEGDWILSKNCVFGAKTLTPKANVIVKSGVKVKLGSGAVLDIDFKNFFLRVEKDGGIMIDPQASIL